MSAQLAHASGAAVPPPAPEAPQGDLLRGGARGAALGAIGGAMALTAAGDQVVYVIFGACTAL